MKFSYLEFARVNWSTRVGGYIRAYICLTCREGYLLPFEAVSDGSPYQSM